MINRKLLAAILAVIALTVFGTFVAIADNDDTAADTKACAEACKAACTENCQGKACDPEACKTACAGKCDGKTCDAGKAAECAKKCADKCGGAAQKAGATEAKPGCSKAGSAGSGDGGCCAKKATPQKTG